MLILKQKTMWHMHEGTFWGMHFLWWIVFIVLLLWLFVFPKMINRRSESESPLEILKKRYAKGELSKEQYEEGKHILEQH